jgi:NAD-dependent dihydropyrimidine dehydrogenase PreA subunit
MAYVIIDTCTKDEECIQVCPVDCIHPRKDEAGFEEVPQLYIEPEGCIDCGACIPACPTNSIFPVDDLAAEHQSFIEVNANHYKHQLG